MISIRKGLREDAEKIVSYQVLMADETESLILDYDIVFRGVLAVIEDEGKGFYLVSEVDNKMVGSMLITFEWSDWRAKTIYWIHSLYVEPEFRRRGIFKGMYKYLKSDVAESGATAGIRLYVDKTNIQAQEVYKSLGMNGEHYQLFEDMD